MTTSARCVILFVVVSLSVSVAANPSRQAEASSTPLIDRFLASEEPPLRTYRARRVLRAANPGDQRQNRHAAGASRMTAAAEPASLHVTSV